MKSYASRVGRRPLALTLAALGALAACADEPPVTAPQANPAADLAVGDVITITSTSGGTGAGSLRWAVGVATGGEIIRFDPSLAGRTITLDSTLVIRKYVTIEGPQSGGITISGGGRGRVVDVTNPSLLTDPAVKLRNLSITGGKLVNEDNGAGIRTAAPLLLEHSTVWGNEAPESPAIHVLYGNEITIFNSTVSGNVSSRNAFPAIRADGRVILAQSTVAHNSHGGIYVGTGSASLRSSIIARNGAENCENFQGAGHEGPSLSDDVTCGDSMLDNMVIGDAKLLPLADNGGPGMTHALAPLSAALNGQGLCSTNVDQRYVARVSGQCDFGAFESTDPRTVAFTVDPSATIDPVTGVVRIGGTLTCARSTQFGLSVQLRQKDVQGSDAVLALGCGTSAQRWSALIAPTGGAFRKGAATVTITTQQAMWWVTPGTTSLSIKLARLRN